MVSLFHFEPFCRLDFLLPQGPASAAVDYFGSFGYPCPQYCNPADFILRLLRSGPAEGAPGDLVADLAAAHTQECRALEGRAAAGGPPFFLLQNLK